MKKRKKTKGSRLKSTQYRQSANSQVVEIEPEKVVVFARLAEKYVVPIIKEHQLPPATALILLTQYTHALATGQSQHSVESAMVLTSQILELWKTGYYTPSLEYPYTLEETLKDGDSEEDAKQDYSTSFQPFHPFVEDVPLGIGQVYSGLVKHPHTHLWQIWVMIERQCMQLGAYHDPAKAQKGLQALISLSRRGGSTIEIQAVFNNLVSQADEIPQQMPLNMMHYLVDHIDLYKIDL